MKLEVINLEKKFKDFTAVNNINFCIDEGQTLGVLGPNGCGKTTTIGMLLGLIKPSNGKILINEENFENLNREKILSKFNFASPYVELPKKLTVRENLEIYGRLYGVDNLNKRIQEISHDLKLNLFLNKKTGELSSGQKNRLSLAKSLINNPKMLFLDEPTASLDPDIGDFVRKYIEEYKSKHKISILLASHNMKEVERLCDEVIMMKEGKIVDRGTCQSLIDKHGRNNLEDTFLKLARNKNELE